MAAGIVVGKKGNKTLFVFDFDHTLVDDNTDTFIMDLCPQLDLKRSLRARRKDFSSWTQFMDHVFYLVHKEGCTKDDIKNHMRKLPLYQEATKSIRLVYESDTADAIILSDSNTIFIQLILEECNISHMFKAVFTNPAHFEADGRLRVEHLCQHDCKVCTSPNICKSKVLREYRQSLQQDYCKVVYVGDGEGDFCPASSLSRDDIVICREGYTLARMLSSEPCTASVYVVNFVEGLSETIRKCL